MNKRIDELLSEILESNSYALVDRLNYDSIVDDYPFIRAKMNSQLNKL